MVVAVTVICNGSDNGSAIFMSDTNKGLDSGMIVKFVCCATSGIE